MSTRGLLEKQVASLPEARQRQVDDFARFLRLDDADAHFNGRLISKPALAGDRSTPERDAAWASL